MKKFLAPFVIATICAMTANAQGTAPTAAVAIPTPTAKNSDSSADNNQRMMQKRNEMREKYKNATPEERQKMEKEQGKYQKWENASPEEKARMEKRREMMEKLSPQQKEALRNEMERHHAEMKKITGFDDVVPAAPTAINAPKVLASPRVPEKH